MVPKGARRFACAQVKRSNGFRGLNGQGYKQIYKYIKIQFYITNSNFGC